MIVIDIETTGQVPWIHSMLSIGAVDFSSPSNQFYRECRVREGARIDPVALRINGFKRAELSSSKREPQRKVLREFLEWPGKIKDNTLAGHNHYMDVYFLGFALMSNKIKNPFRYRLVDTHTITYVSMLKRRLSIPLDNGGSGINSDVFLRYCGLPKEPTPHNALTGAEMEAEALSRLIYGKNMLKEYKEFKIPGYLKKK